MLTPPLGRVRTMWKLLHRLHTQMRGRCPTHTQHTNRCARRKHRPHPARQLSLWLFCVIHVLHVAGIWAVFPSDT